MNDDLKLNFLGFSFESLAALAAQLPQNREVREKAQQLDEERRALLRGWEQKDDFLRQTFDLQIFNKEADQIDAATSSQEAFLEFQDLGVRVSISHHHYYLTCSFLFILLLLLFIIIHLLLLFIYYVFCLLFSFNLIPSLSNNFWILKKKLTVDLNKFKATYLKLQSSCECNKQFRLMIWILSIKL